jgi:hypothetical protein
VDFDKANRTLKALKATGKKQTVSLGNSIVCRVGVTGSRVLYFSMWEGGKLVKHRLGEYPAVTASEAFEKAREIRSQVHNGKSPKAEKRRADRVASRPQTVADLAERFKAEHVAVKNRSKWAEEVQRMIQKDILPELGPVPLADVERADITDLIDRKKATVLAKGGKGTAANRLASVLQRLFTWSAQKGYSPFELGLRLEKAVAETPRSRVLTGVEIGQLWNALAEARAGRGPVHTVYGDVLSLMLLGGTRGSELTGPTDDDVPGLTARDVDTARGLFVIRKGKTQASVRSVVMPPAMRAIVEAAVSRATDPDALLFQVPAGGKIQWHQLSKACLQMREALGHSGYTTRDIRRTVTTIMGEAGVDRDVRRKVVGHAGDDAHERVYEMSQRPDDYRAALQQVEDYVLNCAAKAADGDASGVESWGK